MKKKTFWVLFFVRKFDQIEIKDTSSIWSNKPNTVTLREYGFGRDATESLLNTGRCDDKYSKLSYWLLLQVEEGRIIL
jgi:hypothetical protein